jgi:hypothetical protein
MKSAFMYTLTFTGRMPGAPLSKGGSMSWTLDSVRKVWICSCYSDLDGTAINNLAEYGEPFTPYEHPGWVEDFVPDFANVVVEMSQVEVMSHGYGRNITADQFPIVKRFLAEKPSIPTGTFSFERLIRLGYASGSDRWIHSNLYGWGPYSITSGDLDSADAAYVHGSVALALMAQTRFYNGNVLRRVDAEIGAGDDNWDFESDTIPPVVEVGVAVLLGPDHYNLDKPIKIRFVGPGKRSIVETPVQIPAR